VDDPQEKNPPPVPAQWAPMNAELPELTPEMRARLEQKPIAYISSDMLAEPEPEPEEPAETRRDFERDMSVWPRLSLLLIAANAVIFIIVLSRGGLESQEAILLAGALSREHVVQGEVWRGLSAMFLHGGWDHLIGNCVALFILGMASEHAFGLTRTALLYFATGVVASFASITFSPGPSVGASGAIFGLMGVMIAFFRRHGEHFFLRDNRVGVVLIVWAVYSILTALAQPFIDNAAHVGGLLSGLVLGWLVPPEILERTPPKAAPSRR
jgi:rhomboid protease GluP